MIDQGLCILADQLCDEVHQMDITHVDSDTRLLLMYDIGRTLILLRALTGPLYLNPKDTDHGLN